MTLCVLCGKLIDNFMSTSTKKTEVGSYFISNYPPFSAWSVEELDAVRAAMNAPPAEVPLGLYLHIPFCRKRCKFCYFKVFTDKNSDEVERYLAALVARDRAGQQAARDGRPAVSICVFRRRHAVVSELAATDAARRPAARKRLVGQSRGSHVRVRAGHAFRSRRSKRSAKSASRG